MLHRVGPLFLPVTAPTCSVLISKEEEETTQPPCSQAQKKILKSYLPLGMKIQKTLLVTVHTRCSPLFSLLAKQFFNSELLFFSRQNADISTLLYTKKRQGSGGFYHIPSQMLFFDAWITS